MVLFTQGGLEAALSHKEIAVRDMIQAYRSRGHLLAKTNPVRERRNRDPRLALSDFGLSDEDMKTSFQAGTLLHTKEKKTLKEIVQALRTVYTGTVGFEYMHMRDPAVLEWFKVKCEKESLQFNPSQAEKTRILSKLNEAVVFESFLHTKYIGQKRFSLEGAESAIPALDTVLQKGAELGLEEVVIGMAHRGRLSVLANIMGKEYDQIFKEFEGADYASDAVGDGDVKYHMGYSSVKETKHGMLGVKLAPNPSHLEAVDPVVAGQVRAKMDHQYQGDSSKIIPVLIHGDAAIAGQGILYELVQMSKLEAYQTGGTLHFVINNQVGFTTDFDEARSSIYCTDLAKIVDSPIFHVNGDDPEAVVFCVQMALEFRQKFQQDVFVDMVCYRKHGHNESDEPRFTQPLLYKTIASHPNPREVYLKQLVERGEADADLARSMDKEFRNLLQEKLQTAKQKKKSYKLSPLEKEWQNMRRSRPKDFEQSPFSKLLAGELSVIKKNLTTLPKGFHALKQITKLVEQRKDMLKKRQINWATAELMAYASLLVQGHHVRLVGQDVQRGTFSHRHATLTDSKTNQKYNALNRLQEKQGEMYIYNSLLSEYGALGFEFGYATASPNVLVLWEAQFGDFANGAQIMIDQFIATAFTKWQRMSGLVMLLPHGYEGQGPEHSSARLERFLQLCAGYNMFVCYPTTPSNFYHLLRRQLLLPFRMPLVVMSPKSLFRHPKVVSPLRDIVQGKFQELLPDELPDKRKVRRVLLCSGKIYYDLLDARTSKKRKDVAILRLEQLHPLPEKALLKELNKYPKAERYWVQEEPENAGARDYFLRTFKQPVHKVVARRSTASPATGYHKTHLQEQKEIVDKAFSA